MATVAYGPEAAFARNVTSSKNHQSLAIDRDGKKSQSQTGNTLSKRMTDRILQAVGWLQLCSPIKYRFDPRQLKIHTSNMCETLGCVVNHTARPFHAMLTMKNSNTMNHFLSLWTNFQ